MERNVHNALVSCNIFENSNTTLDHACNMKRQASQPYGRGTEIRKLRANAVQRIPRISNTIYSATSYINMLNFARFSSLVTGG